MDDRSRIYDDVSWLLAQAANEQGSSRTRVVASTAAVMALAGAVGFGGAMLVHDSVSASTSTATTSVATTTSTSTTATTQSTASVAAPQTTTTTANTASGGS